MALDVHLTRELNERWGFDLVGGADDETPLTIQKVQPSSPASRAGLQNGDAILTINGEEVLDSTNLEASRKIAECDDAMTLGVMRGLYNLVLDDQEPVYYEQGDLDPQSQPTEVSPFKIQNFVEPEDLGSKLIDFDANNDPLGPPFDPSVLLTDNRSLTASPFATPTKPYRPFSTEPIPEIPSLEDPIILNPDYKDTFGKAPVDIIPDYIINGVGIVESKFKLPISEQYDPDGTRRAKNAEVDSLLSKYAKLESLSKTSVANDVKTAVKDVKVTEKSTKDVKIGEIIKDKKETFIQDTVSKDYVTKDMKEVKESSKITEDLCIRKEVTNKEESLKTDKKEKHVMMAETEEESLREELKHIEKMKEEMDISQIEKTAVSIVDDSIERAVSVAEEIKKEIEDVTSETEVIKTESKKKESTTTSQLEIKESAELIDTQVTKSQSKKTSDVAVSENVKKTEEFITDSESVAIKEDIKTSSQKEKVTEKITQKNTEAAYESKSTATAEYKERVVKDTPAVDYSENKYENKDQFVKVSKTVTSDSRSDKKNTQQRTYVGLKTIPSIKGVVHSSYHYNLLLQTFFFHLTDVMVALSRFLLSQPIFNTETSELHKTVSETQKYESGIDIRKREDKEVECIKREAKQEKRAEEIRVEEKKQEIKAVSQKSEKDLKVQENKIERRVLVTPTPIEETKIESHEKVQQAKELAIKSDFKDTKTVEKSEVKEELKKDERATKSQEKKITGAEMAQRTEKKLTKEVTQKMDAVISEFQTIAVEEDKQEMLQRSRSRSRSVLEEEVAKESDPLEWLSKVDSRRESQEKSEERLSKTEFSSSETVERKQLDKLEKHEIKHKKSKTPKQMYVAVVESHVYTNKDVIFEDAAEFSETSSVQSAEEINTAFEAIETMSTENVALESAVQQLEQAKIVEESQQLVTVSGQSEATVKKIEEVVQESSSIKQEEFKQEIASQKTDIQEVVIQESKEIIEPVIEIKETIKKDSATVDINKSLSIAESSEINIQESKSEFTSVESKTESLAIIEEDYKKSAIVEEKVEVIKTETKEVKPPVQIEEVSAKVVIQSEKDYKKEEEFAALKIIKEVETEIESTNEIIEVEEEIDVSDNATQDTVIKKIEMTQALVLDESNIVTEKTMASSEIGYAKSVDTKIDISSSKQVDIKNYKSESHITEDIIQESSFTARSVDKKLSIRTDLDIDKSIQSPPSTIDTPTPSTVPPTPLTDEYVFKLSIPLPKSRGTTPIPRDSTLTPEDEDPHIVKKKLIPHIETTIEKIVYDPPLPTPPPGDKLQSSIFKTPGLFGGSNKPIYKIKFPPVYRKPGLYGGADRPEYTKEEIREIERKSSLLASAIDQTIKSIEEYKEEVGMEKNKEVITETKQKITENNYQETYKEKTIIESKQNGYKETDTSIEEIEEVDTNCNNTDNSVVKIEEFDTEVITNGNNIHDSKVKIEEFDTENKQHSPNEEIKPVFENGIQKEAIENEISNNIDIENNNSEKTIQESIKRRNMMVDTTYIRPDESEIEVTETVNAVMESEPVSEPKVEEEPSEKEDPLLRVRPVVFDPESIQKRINPHLVIQVQPKEARQSPYMTETGEIIGTTQGIVDGLDEQVMDAQAAKDIGKPGMTEEKIAELISGEAEMLREAHVMGLSRVLKSHMHRADDSSVDFQKIKPMIGSLKDSEVLKALNEELMRKKEEEKKKEEKKWTTFLQKPKRPVPKVKFGYHGWTQNEQALVLEPYKVKIVKQAKPKVAPDYKPEDFNTGPLPWEQRAEIEAAAPPVEPEDPILIPELPEFLEAVDPLKESEVPDLEDTGIPLPPPKEPTPPPEIEQIDKAEDQEQTPTEEQQPEEQEAEVTEAEKTQEESKEDMENKLADQLVRSVQGMVDPNAPVDQQLAQMRAQLAALAQLPEVIQKTLAMVSQQLNMMSTQESRTEVKESRTESQTCQEMEVFVNQKTEAKETLAIESAENIEAKQNNEIVKEEEVGKVTIEEVQDNTEVQKTEAVQQEKQLEIRRVETPQLNEEELKIEKLKKEQQLQAKLDSEARQLKQRPTPRVGKPKRMFGPPDPDNRPVVLPGGRRWRKTADVYTEAMLAETLQAQAELIQGKAMGFESDLLPYDNRINFMKYEKPPVSLDHLQSSATYKLVHDMDQTPLKRVELLTPVIAEADYRERCRSMTPGDNKHMQIPQQFHP